MFRLGRLLFGPVLVTCLLTPAHPLALAPASIGNGRITAQFGDRGLVSLADAAEGGIIRFPEDDFSVTIGDSGPETDVARPGTPLLYDSRKLPAPVRSVAKDRVTYAWTAGAYRFTVVYELAPGWRFVSKQVSIASASIRTFAVNDIRVFRSSLAEPVADVFVPKNGRPNLGTGDYGACLRFADGSRGLLAVVQNPFLQFQRDGQSFSLGYKPEMSWNMDDGPFVADRGLLAPYRLVGRKLPERMLPEWRLGAPDGGPGMDEAEVEAFTDLVRVFLLVKPPKPVNVLVGWCLNDYQIDVSTPEGRQEYKRIFDAAASVGADYFLYAPTNLDLARREDSLDDWSWENLLWLGLGQKIRKNEWNPRTSPVPASLQEMLDYAKSKNLKLLAYVYPVLPFRGNPAWLVSPKGNPTRHYANLGFRSLQDWLIDTLVAFHGRLGLGGYAFDHTFLGYDGTSRYAQWHGWRRVMEELRRRVPDIVIDGRQAYHLYGPWSWLAGSYPHPTFNDEQPESFVPFPDLHFDRVSANRERFTGYRYRNYEFAPSEIVPGFITHQTSRADDTGNMPERKTDRGVALLPFRERDWDYLGWRYSLLSSIAIAGWNNVLDVIPARDVAEYRAFSDVDRQWFRRWLDWTNTNKEFLRRTRTILGQPAMGKVDGTSAIVGNRGFIFLFNPNGRRLTADFALDSTIGLTTQGRFVLKELYPVDNRMMGKPAAGAWTAGDRVSITMDGGSAIVLELQPAPATVAAPILFNTPGSAAIENGVLSIAGARGEMGAREDVLVVLPPGQSISAMRVNSVPVQFSRAADVVTAPIRFEGAPFRHYQQIGAYDPAFGGGRLAGTFSIPRRVFDQLAARQKAWPIPWTAEDFRTTWLVPERLLLFVQIAEPDDRWEARLTIDGRTVDLRKAYTAVRVARRTFVGFYADLSLLSPDREYSFELELPALRPGQFQGLFFENVETEYTERILPRPYGVGPPSSAPATQSRLTWATR